MDKQEIRNKFMEGYRCPNIEEGIKIMKSVLPNFSYSPHLEALNHFLSIYTKENGMILGMIWDAFGKLLKESHIWSFVDDVEFHRYYSDQLPEMSKGEAFSKLSNEKYEFDYALPQNWLDQFVLESRLDYHRVLSTTVWVYERKSHRSGAVSICVEVQRALEIYFYKEN